MNALWLPLVGGAVLLTGCVVSTGEAGPVQYDSPSFERADVKEVRLNLNMGAGDLKVGTGTRKLMQAYFTYNVPAWKPQVDFSTSEGVGSFTIRQPSGTHGHFGNRKYEWDLRLVQDVPIDLHLNFGAGKAELDLGALTIRGVNVDMGVGQLIMDLRGTPKHDYNVRVSGGVGEAILHLPSNVGVYAQASGGIGGINVRNLRQEEGHYVNEAYGHSPVTIHINVEGGVGSIQLLGE
jgi:hypothetical protein